MTVKRYCNFCGKDFDCSNERERFCSNFCEEQSDSQFKELKIMEQYVYQRKCKLCGDEFYTGDNQVVFCSQECEDIVSCKLYSGSSSIRSNLTIDHIVPVSKGGKNKNNLTLACFSCNVSKGDKTREEFEEYLKNNPDIVELRRKVAEENYNKIEKQKMIFDLVNRTLVEENSYDLTESLF